MYLYDSNIFLEILLGQKKATDCFEALNLMSEHNLGFISQFSLHAIEAIVGSKKRFQVLSAFLDFIHQHPYLSVYSTALSEEKEISLNCEKWRLDFDDGLQYFITKKEDWALVTLDRDFKKLPGLNLI